MELDCIYRLINTTSEEELSETFTLKLKEIGVHSYAYFHFNSNRAPDIIGTYSEEWVEQYVSCGYEKVDQTVSLCSISTSPFTWSFAKNLSLSQKQRQFWHDAKDNKLDAGFSVPINSSSQSVVGLGCSIVDADEAKWLSKYKKEIFINSNVFHSKRNDITNSPELSIRQFKITSRELECGKWLCAGLTLDQMANKLSISERTVRFHIENLKQKLNVENREQIIVKLISKNIVVP